MKSICVLLFVLGFAALHINADCPDTEDVVWALDGFCFVFRNKCYFDKENKNNKPPLEIVSKEECQPNCATICPAVYQPVSGNYKGQIKHFSNACEKAVHSCTTGETFI